MLTISVIAPLALILPLYSLAIPVQIPQTTNNTNGTGPANDTFQDPFTFDGGYWRPKTTAIDLLSQPGLGGTQVVPGAASMKRDLAMGVLQTLPRYESEFRKWGMGGDPSLAQHVIAEAAFETSMGLQWPTKEDQTKETNPQIPYTKWGTMSQEIGPLRMNRDMLLSLNYTEQDILTMNSKTVAGNMMAGEAWVKALAMYGEIGFYFFHRGGRGRYNQFKNQTLNSETAMDTWAFMNGIFSYQLTMITHKLGTSTDVVPWSSKNVPWV